MTTIEILMSVIGVQALGNLLIIFYLISSLKHSAPTKNKDEE